MSGKAFGKFRMVETTLTVGLVRSFDSCLVRSFDSCIVYMCHVIFMLTFDYSRNFQFVKVLFVGIIFCIFTLDHFNLFLINFKMIFILKRKAYEENLRTRCVIVFRSVVTCALETGCPIS